MSEKHYNILMNDWLEKSAAAVLMSTYESHASSASARHIPVYVLITVRQQNACD